MNTPAHVIVNLLVLGRQDTTTTIVPVVVGAILPDAPMFLFYFVEKVLRGTPERIIWSERYHQLQWQNFFDVFNSVPLIFLGLGLTVWASSKIGTLVFGSMLLHACGDFPLHNNDAHRHFFPFTNWRFISPVSYWDPRHYGLWVSAVEILAVITGCILLFMAYDSLAGRLSVGIVGALYLVYFIYVVVVWI